MNRLRLCQFIVVMVAVATFVRLFFSIDFNDESLYAAHVINLVNDGRLFQSDALIHATAAVPIFPLSAAYLKLVGPSGLVLFLRMLYFGLALTTAWCSYRFFRARYEQTDALLAGILFVAFIPFVIPSWSYNTVGYLVYPLSIFALLNHYPIVAGALASVVCLSYPPLSLAYGILLVALWYGPPPFRGILNRSEKTKILITLLTGGVLSLVIIASAGWDKLSLILQFTSVFKWAGGSDKLGLIGQAFTKGFFKSQLWILVLLGSALRFFNAADFLRRYNNILLVIFLALLTTGRLYEHGAMTWMIYAPLAIVCFVWFGRISYEPDVQTRFLLGTGLLCACVIGYFSTNVLINASLGLMLPLQILLLEASKSFNNSRSQKPAHPNLAIAISALILSSWNYVFVYGDSPILKLNTMISSGPYAGLVTTPYRAALLQTLENDLRKLTRTNTTIFASYFTGAYLLSPLKPLTTMLYIPERRWSQEAIELMLYQTKKLNRWPDLFLTRKFSDPQFEDQFEPVFAKSGRYRLEIDGPDYRIFVRTHYQD